MDVAQIQTDLARFAAEREWQRFHSPKNLSMAIAGEAGELVSLFQWLSEDESRKIAEDELKMNRICDEMADVLIYLLRLADVLNVNVQQIIDTKIAANAIKYPVALSKGNAIKYSHRDPDKQ
jgi:NTP pyrophosphatase (non-canonical NTP hydrolase)